MKKYYFIIIIIIIVVIAALTITNIKASKSNLNYYLKKYNIEEEDALIMKKFEQLFVIIYKKNEKIGVIKLEQNRKGFSLVGSREVAREGMLYTVDVVNLGENSFLLYGEIFDNNIKSIDVVQDSDLLCSDSVYSDASRLWFVEVSSKEFEIVVNEKDKGDR